jgi:hypothetical protein
MREQAITKSDTQCFNRYFVTVVSTTTRLLARMEEQETIVALNCGLVCRWICLIEAPVARIYSFTAPYLQQKLENPDARNPEHPRIRTHKLYKFSEQRLKF